MTDAGTTDDFDDFVGIAEPRLRRALVAAYGPEIGREAALDALSWGWEHWSRLSTMSNPIGYLYRVGQSCAGEHIGRRIHTPGSDRSAVSAAADQQPFEPALPAALRRLSDQQRAAVLLVHGHGIPLREAAELMEISVATVRKHCERAMKHLRAALEASDVG